MKPILVLYATRQGYARKVAEYIGNRIQESGVTHETLDAACVPSGLSLDAYSAAILVASVHRGKHEPEMIDFARRHVAELDRTPTAFISVSLSEAGVEDKAASLDRRAASAADVQWIIDNFTRETGWHPKRTVPAAGALSYTKYNFVLRFVMKQIARKAGVSTDTSADREFTDWQALDNLVTELVHATAPVGLPS